MLDTAINAAVDIAIELSPPCTCVVDIGHWAYRAFQSGGLYKHGIEAVSAVVLYATRVGKSHLASSRALLHSYRIV